MIGRKSFPAIILWKLLHNITYLTDMFCCGLLWQRGVADVNNGLTYTHTYDDGNTCIPDANGQNVNGISIVEVNKMSDPS